MMRLQTYLCCRLMINTLESMLMLTPQSRRPFALTPMSTSVPYDFDLGPLTDYSAYITLSSDSCYQGIGGYGEVYDCNLGTARLAIKIIRRATTCDKEAYNKVDMIANQ